MSRPVALAVAFLLALPAVASAQDVAEEDAPWWQDEVTVSDVVPETGGEGRAPQPAAPPPWAPEVPALPATTMAVVPGDTARMRRDGKAAIPRGAPKRVRDVLRAANLIVGKPYKWGGGHGRLFDSGYDCSGAVSYALIRAGHLRSPLVSGALARTYRGGAGRWLTVYANKGHVYMEVAGLRLDTSPVGDRGGRKGVRWRPVIGRRGGFAARHIAGL